jgi:hypothetical protein
MSRRYLCAAAAAWLLFSTGNSRAEVPEAASARMREGFAAGKIPTTVYFRDGQVVERVFGAVPKETLVDLLKK